MIYLFFSQQLAHSVSRGLFISQKYPSYPLDMASSLSWDVGFFFLRSFHYILLMAVQWSVVIFGVFMREGELMSFYYAILFQ